jgi:DNA-binding winged helix-turn-helix (wHTH) protein
VLSSSGAQWSGGLVYGAACFRLRREFGTLTEMDQGHVRESGAGCEPPPGAGVPCVIHFPPFRLDLRLERLCQGADAVPLKPRAFAILRYLAEQAGRLVTKSELLTQIWGDVHVNEAVLKTHLGEIRRALADDVRSPRYIETAHRRGYRFIAPTEREPSASAPASHAADPSVAVAPAAVAPAAVAPAAVAPAAVASAGAIPAPAISAFAGRPSFLDAPEASPAPRTAPERPFAPGSTDTRGAAPVPEPVPRAPMGAGGPPHFVGRAPELEWLRAALDEASLGQRQVVLINGPAGIGKTSLVRAFSNGLLRGAASIAWGQCVDQCGSEEAYLPLIEALSRLGRGPDRARWLELLNQCAPSWVARLPSFRAVSSAPHAAPSGFASSEHMLCQLADALETFAQQDPLLLVLEDIQWADASTLSWLAYVARRTDPACLLVLCTFRPLEASRKTHPLSALKRALDRQSPRAELKLPYLSEADLAQYVAARFPGCLMPRELLALLHGRTAGNPLFLVRVLDAWIERGVLEQRSGQWQLTVEPGPLQRETPESVVCLIEQEYEPLSELESGVIEAAAVAGQEFSVASIASALSAELVNIEDLCVRWAKHGQFFQIVGRERWPDGTLTTRLAFIHALYRETAYMRLGAARQAQLHLGIARWQERAYGERSVEIAQDLAFHFERGQDYRRAALHLCSAGERALATSAYAEAGEHFEKGLALLEHLPHGVKRARIEIRLQVGVAMLLAATRNDAVERVRAARTAVTIGKHFLAAANARDDEQARLRSTLLLGMAEACLGALHSARARLQFATAHGNGAATHLSRPEMAHQPAARARAAPTFGSQEALLVAHAGVAPGDVSVDDGLSLATASDAAALPRELPSRAPSSSSHPANSRGAILTLTWRAMLCAFLGESAANDAAPDERFSDFGMGTEELMGTEMEGGEIIGAQALLEWGGAGVRPLDEASAPHGTLQGGIRRLEPQQKSQLRADAGAGRRSSLFVEGHAWDEPHSSRPTTPSATDAGSPEASPSVQWVEGLLRQALSEVDSWFGEEAVAENDADVFEYRYGYRAGRRAAEGSRRGSPATPRD